jgi:hypothetical protein
MSLTDDVQAVIDGIQTELHKLEAQPPEQLTALTRRKASI